MNCSRCDLELQPGARHVIADDCVEALRAKLAHCEKCGGRVGCLTCGLVTIGHQTYKEATKNLPDGAKIGLGILGKILGGGDRA